MAHLDICCGDEFMNALLVICTCECFQRTAANVDRHFALLLGSLVTFYTVSEEAKNLMQCSNTEVQILK